MVSPPPPFEKPPLFFRVMAVTDHSDNSGASTTSHTYCQPSTKIWITEDDLANPAADILVITEMWNNVYTRVIFEYDGGRYFGRFEAMGRNLDSLFAKPVIPAIFRSSGIEHFMVIEDISSL